MLTSSHPHPETDTETDIETDTETDTETQKDRHTEILAVDTGHVAITLTEIDASDISSSQPYLKIMTS